jgi:hypothetical protein
MITNLDPIVRELFFRSFSKIGINTPIWSNDTLDDPDHYRDKY